MTTETSCMNFAQKIFDSKQSWTSLSKIDVQGSLNFVNLTIEFGSLDGSHFTRLAKLAPKAGFSEFLKAESLPAEVYQELKEILPLLVHEYTHFLDTCSTVWGLEYLSRLNDAYSVLNVPGAYNEQNLEKLKIFNDVARSIALPEYFTELHPKVDASRPWSLRTSRGKRFGADGKVTDQPIMFGVFLNSSGERIVRSPISIASLLEVGAMAQELFMKARLVQQLDEDIQFVEQKQLLDRELEVFYNSGLTEYSVCAHLVANQQSAPDILQTLRLASKIAYVALNLTTEIQERITITDDVLRKLAFDPGSTEARDFVRDAEKGDRGIWFYVISRLVPAKSHGSNDAARQGIETALGSLGVTLEEVLSSARLRIGQLAEELVLSGSGSIATFGRVALSNFDERRVMDESLIWSDRIEYPPAMYGDWVVRTFFNKESAAFEISDFEENFNQLYDLQKATANFVEACISPS